MRGGDAVALAGEVDHVIGVDTHMDTHTAALCDARQGAVAAAGDG